MAKTAAVLFAMLVTLQLNAQTNRIDNECFSLSCPSSWEHEDVSIGPMFLSFIASPGADNMYIVLSYNFYMDMYNFIKMQVVDKANDIFKNSESGEIYSCQYNGRDAMAVNSDVVFDDTDYKSKTYGFMENGRSLMVVEMVAKGKYHDFSDMSATLTVKDKKKDKMDARSSMTSLVNDMKNSGVGLNTYIDEGVRFSNIDISPDRDRVIYYYVFEMLDKNEVNSAALGEFKSELKKVFIAMLKENYSANEMIHMCMEEDFEFLYKIYDKYDRYLVEVLVVSEDYK